MWQNHSTEVGRAVAWAPLRNRLRMPWVEASSMGRVLYCPPMRAMTVCESKSEAGVLGFVRRGGEVGEERKSGRLGSLRKESEVSRELSWGGGPGSAAERSRMAVHVAGMIFLLRW